MAIDEARDRNDSADHSLIEVKINGGRMGWEKKKEWERVEYYSVGKEELGTFIKGVENREGQIG